MTNEEAIKRNPFDANRGNESAYCRYLRYNVTGWYNLDSKEVLRRWQKSEENVCEDCYYNDGEVHAECIICDKAESEVNADDNN